MPKNFGSLIGMSKRDLARFGGVVRQRREELGLQQEDVRDYGGPSSTTMSMVERGIAVPSASTLRKLDHGLGWVRGSAAETLDGGDPVPHPRADDEKYVKQLTSGFGEEGSNQTPDLIHLIEQLTEALEMLNGASPKSELLGQALANAVQATSLAAKSVGSSMRSEAARQLSQDWLERYAEYFQQLALVVARIAVVVGQDAPVRRLGDPLSALGLKGSSSSPPQLPASLEYDQAQKTQPGVSTPGAGTRPPTQEELALAARTEDDPKEDQEPDDPMDVP